MQSSHLHCEDSGHRDGKAAFGKFAREHSLLLKFVLPIVSSAVALGLARLTTHYADAPIFVYLVLATAVCAWVSGSLAGVAALVLGFLGGFYFLLAPVHSFRAGNPGGLVRLSAQVVVAALLIYIAARLKAAERRYGDEMAERSRADESLRYLSAIVESSDDAIIGKRLDGVIVSWNRGAERLYGYEAAEAIGKHISMLVPSGERDDVAEIMRRVSAGEPVTNYETIRRRKDGAVLNVQLTVSPIRDQSGQIVRISTAARDITRLKHTEKALGESEASLRTIFDAVYDGILIHSADGQVMDVNHRCVAMYGISSGELLGMDVRALSSPSAPVEKLQPVWAEVLAGQTHLFEWKARRPHDGTEFDAEVFLRKIRMQGQDAIMANIRDISERKRAGRALRESEQLFRAVAENIPQMIWVADNKTEYQYLSPKWLEYTGTTWEQNTHGGWVESVHPEDASGALQRWENAIRIGGVYETEYRLRRHDGEYRWHLARAVPIADGDGEKTWWFGTTTDIEDRKRAQLALIRSEKLAATGRLASSVAHEINNPLAAALNSLYLALLDDRLSDVTRLHIDGAQRQLERVAHITRQTLGFYRETGKPMKVDLRKVADSVVDLYTPRLKNKDITLEREYLTQAPVFAIEGEVRQILSNLVSNSIDAVGDQGCIRLRVAGPVTLDDGRPMVRLTVSDNGAGIEPEHLPKIFEPFFSTKEATGTGLGLWVTQQLVKKHTGKIRIRSKPGEGTVFEVFLPMERRNEQRLAEGIEAIA